ncbi:DivIVA domain-containing protein [Lactococcus nasutitermitis]|uniref:DivIVA domain-containing protein n=1 Tax=Lactococcus nasutitermitis TaxID=1652957 RepID=A0ABV9JA16_9LACT|nr:DivIVA domain-containing protein [Lactococcus nasutitermitis]
MTLNSLDVQNKRFNPQMRGFNKQEVDEFLDIVVRDYDEFSQTIKSQKVELKSLREQVKYFDDMKDTLNKSLVVAQGAADKLSSQSQEEATKRLEQAQQDADNITEDARRRGQSIIDDAKKEAGSILHTASEDARKLIRESDNLRRRMRSYHERAVALAEAQVTNLQSDDWKEMFAAKSTEGTNPEEKLQEILDVHLNTPIAVSGDTEAIQTIPDEMLENVEKKAEPEAENFENTPETEQHENEEQSSEAEVSVETTSENPEGDNSLDSQATIDLGNELNSLENHE